MTGSIVLGLVGIAAIIIELFVPAGGLIGLVGLGSITAAVIRTFRQMGPGAGAAFLTAVVVAVPAVLILWFRLFPKTRVGKKLILGDTPAGAGEREESGLAGKSGIALTALRPTGTALIEGKRYSVVADGVFVEKGRAVIVKKRDGNRIVVREGAK